MSLFGSIENKHGMNDPDYEYSEPDAPRLNTKEWGHTLNIYEVLAAFLLPISSLGFAIWRFGRGDIGPGFANLMLGTIGFVLATILLAHL